MFSQTNGGVLLLTSDSADFVSLCLHWCCSDRQRGGQTVVLIVGDRGTAGQRDLRMLAWHWERSSAQHCQHHHCDAVKREVQEAASGFTRIFFCASNLKSLVYNDFNPKRCIIRILRVWKRRILVIAGWIKGCFYYYMSTLTWFLFPGSIKNDVLS